MITLDGPLDATLMQQIDRAVVELLKQDDKTALVLEVLPGEDDPERVLELAEFLASSAARPVRTIAWVPETLLGPRLLVALVCDDVVMAPDVEFGELAHEADLSEPQRQRMLRVLTRTDATRTSPAVAATMLDESATLLGVTVATDQGEQTRFVLPSELRQLREAGIEIRDVRTLLGENQAGRFIADVAASEGLVVSATASSLQEYLLQSGLREERATEPVDRRPPRKVAVIPVEGEITPGLAAHLERQLERAREHNYDTVVLDVDSPGGLLKESLELAFELADLEERGIRTVAYVEDDAISGAAIISLGCDEIYLHPRARIGDAGPVMIGLDGELNRAPEKIVSYLRETMRELAELKGRPPALVMAMVDRNLKVYRAENRTTGEVRYVSEDEFSRLEGNWEKGRLVPESGDELLLTVNGERAWELGLAEAPVTGFDELRERLGVSEDTIVNRLERTWLDDTIFLLNTPFITGALFFLGVILVFIELHLPSGAFGMLAAVCFGVFFWSKFLGGTAGWLEVMLFTLGLACIAIEVFVIPGFGIFGLGGGAMVLAGLVLASVSFNDVDRGETLREVLSASKSIALSLLAVVVTGFVISHFLPKMPLMGSIVLAPPTPMAARPIHKDNQDPEGLIGQVARSATTLRPSGKIRIDGKLIDAMSTGTYIAADVDVEIVEMRNGRAVVRDLNA